MLPKIESLGYWTDCLLRSFTGTVEERDSYILVRTPDNPTFHWGNFLLFKDAPRENAFAEWIHLFEKEFDKDIGHLTFGWDRDEPGNIDTFLNNGFVNETDITLTLAKLVKPKPSELPIEIRTLQSDADWQELTELQTISGGDPDPTPSYRDFKTRQFANYRKAQNQGHGDWWGAFHDNKLVADMGLYFDQARSIGRFQSVETHPHYRSRGLSSNLLYHIVKHAQNSLPDLKTLVICTENDSLGHRVYQRLGFVFHSRLRGVSLSRNLVQPS